MYPIFCRIRRSCIFYPYRLNDNFKSCKQIYSSRKSATTLFTTPIHVTPRWPRTLDLMLQNLTVARVIRRAHCIISGVHQHSFRIANVRFITQKYGINNSANNNFTTTGYAHQFCYYTGAVFKWLYIHPYLQTVYNIKKKF